MIALYLEMACFLDKFHGKKALQSLLYRVLSC
jgi:hypothetical protein